MAGPRSCVAEHFYHHHNPFLEVSTNHSCQTCYEAHSRNGNLIRHGTRRTPNENERTRWARPSHGNCRNVTLRVLPRDLPTPQPLPTQRRGFQYRHRRLSMIVISTWPGSISLLVNLLFPTLTQSTTPIGTLTSQHTRSSIDLSGQSSTRYPANGFSKLRKKRLAC